MRLVARPWAVMALCFFISASISAVHGLLAQTVEPEAQERPSREAGIPRWLDGDPEESIKGNLYLTVDVTNLTLTLYVDGEPYKAFPVAIGKYRTPTPIGEFAVIDKTVNPGGPFGSRWMGLNVPWGRYGIHGTNVPSSIGSHASMGCIRMFNAHVEEVFPMVPVGTRVLIVGREPRASLTRQLSKGAAGEDVQYVQLRLRRKGFDPGPLDGIFGDDLEAAVRVLQSYYGLSETGEIGEDEAYALGIR